MIIYLDLPCSESGSTIMSYSLASYNAASIPTWVSIDSSGLLTISAPDVSVDTSNQFYVITAVNGGSGSLYKLIKLTVTNWVAQNWDKWSTQGATIWSSWNTGYSLSSGSWVKISETAQTLATTTQSLVGAVVVVVLANNIIGASSAVCLWSLLNQVQMFFLLILTRAYLPFDIQTVIIGPDYALNPYEYIPLNRFKFSFIEKFKIDLSNSLFETQNLNSDSSIYNLYLLFSFVFFILCNHVLIYIIFKFISKWRVNGSRSKWLTFLKWLTTKVVNFLTFQYYIRSILEINQYILISIIYEIYLWNTSEALIISLIFAIVLLVMYLLLIVLVFLLSLSSYTMKDDEHNRLGEFFTNLKLHKKFRLYTPMLMFRRMVYVVILITAVSVHSKIVIGVLCALQIGYWVWISYLRPFVHTKDNIVEITNEVYFFILLFPLINRYKI